MAELYFICKDNTCLL